MICSFALEWTEYLNRIGYDISVSKVCRFLSMLEKCDDISNEQNILSAAKVCLCTTPDQFHQIDEHFNTFITYKASGPFMESFESSKEDITSKILDCKKQINALSDQVELERENIVLKHFNDPLLPEEDVEWLKENRSFVHSLSNALPFVENVLSLAAEERWSQIPSIRACEEQYKHSIRRLSHHKDSISEEVFSDYNKAADILQHMMEGEIRAQSMLKELIKRLEDSYEGRKNDLRKEISRQSNQKNEIMARKNHIEQIQRQFQTGSIVIKNGCSSHRTEFIGGKNAVINSGAAEFSSALEKQFSDLTDKEKLIIQKYIRDNLLAFRTRINRSANVSGGRNIDMQETISQACQTDGLPMRIAYQKPKINKTKIVLILDVSGSCRAASEMMLTFMYILKDIFPRGCTSFAFTNVLYDISDIMNASDVKTAIRNVMNKIPRSGAYSNYFKPLRMICEEHMNEITTDSIVVFMGDARNNKNPSGEEYLKKIARRAKKTYWLNTESKYLWGTADSIANTYMEYSDMMEVTNTQELLLFLNWKF